MASLYFEYFGAKKENIYFHHFTSLFRRDVANTVCGIEEKRKLRNELGFSNKKTAITVGNFIARKKVDVLIKAWSGFSEDYQLMIVGSGDLEFEYKKLVAEL